MSNRYKGGIISATPPTTTGGESGTASGAWTLEQQMQAQAAGLWPLQPTGPYIEDVFSTWLYTGNGSTQTVSNGINLAGKGGLVWQKRRNSTGNHSLTSTGLPDGFGLRSNTTGAQVLDYSSYPFTDTGFTTVYDATNSPESNINGATYASWTFREQPKFFDVVTYTGNGAVQTINHSLGSVPGCIIIKATTSSPGATDWAVWHRSIADGLLLNSTASTSAIGEVFARSVTSTSFNVDRADTSRTNENGVDFVAYVFAHNAGGFGLSGTDNVISCGSFTSDASGNATVNLGYEPQWVLHKRTAGGNWNQSDSMRGMAVTASQNLSPNLSNAESTNDAGNFATLPTSTGFEYSGGSANSTFIYIAIRRGPMRTPTTGTSVFAPLALNNTTGTKNTTNFPVDLQLQAARGVTHNTNVVDRLRGASSTDTQSAARLITNDVNAEDTSTTARGWDNTGFLTPSGFSGVSLMYWNFRRAPGFFDEVCYTGDNSTGQSINHNLGVVPELYICKRRNGTQGGDDWQVYCSYLSSPLNSFLRLVSNAANGTNTDAWQAPTATQIKIGAGLAGYMNASGGTYVAYLFATCPGVSKVGSYTGTGTTQTINCGFTGGARFVMIKRADSTGDWYVWDTARGMIPANDPYLLLNSTAAEVTGTDFVDTAATGFEITSTAPAAINASGGTFIFLAIA